MSNPKNQHYIPRFILRQFSQDGGQIWTFNHDDGIMCRRIEKVFVERHLYTKRSVDTGNVASHSADPKKFKQSIQHDYSYENQISKLETSATPIIRSVVEHARRRECPQLSHTQATVLKRFVFLGARRTTESQARARSTNEPDVFYRAAKAVANRQGFPLPEKSRLYEDGRIEVLENVVTRNSSASFAAGDMPQIRAEIERFCRDTGIQILFCTGRRRFIVGSQWIGIVTERNGHRYSKVSVFPIAPDVAIVPTDRPHREELLLPNDRYVHGINLAVAEQSHTIAGVEQAHFRQYMEHVRHK